MAALYRLFANWLMHGGISGEAASRLARCILIGVVALSLIAAAGTVWTMLSGVKTRQTETRLDGTMAGAAAANAVDAVSMVQQRAASENAIERTVTHAQSAIQAASDTAGADVAGRDGLCAVSAGFCPAARLQQSGAH
jgi:hypothetical protein